MDDVGCFALTELGYGNNAVEMETTAVFDEKTDEIVVNTPHPLAQKYWITNGAVHAKHAVVMAQLSVGGRFCFCSSSTPSIPRASKLSPRRKWNGKTCKNRSARFIAIKI